MSRTIMLVPTSAGVGLTSVSMGVLRAMERKGVNVAFYKLSLNLATVAINQI